MDYESLGFKCGIEIHQRLDTKKLFCECSSDMHEGVEGEIIRKLRAVPGELGEVDPAALYEYLRDREFLYSLYPGESCLVEMDEEPPHGLREEALEATLQVCKILDCEVPEEIHPMRKTVIDGSNTSGFQRTMLVGLDGKLRTERGEVGVQNVCLEEESAQILGREGSAVRYGLNRLGIPLVEIGTAPDIENPEHAREVAEKIGRLLRSTKKVQRGIGTIRQDVNVSIQEGARTEVKGLQELELIERAVELEVQRQVSLLDIRKKLEEEGASVPEETENVKDVFERTESDFGKKLLEKGDVVAFRLENFDGILSKKICDGRTFGEELSEYAEAQGPGGMVHTDEDLEEYGLEEEFEKIEERTGAGKEDVVVVIAGGEGLDGAVRAVKERAREAMEGVPEETRDANPDGTTSYSRPLPGEARMYPETDVPPVSVSKDRLKEIEVPEPLDERKEGLVDGYGLSEHLAEELLGSRFLSLFEETIEELELDATTAADLLTTTLKDLKRRGDIPVELLGEETMKEVLEALAEGKIPRDSISEVLKNILEKDQKVEEAIDDIEVLSDEKLEDIVEEVVAERRDVLGDRKAVKKLMGPVMSKVGGRASGKKVSEKLKEKIKEMRDG